ncbi:MAG: HDOD domain-containing protein [Planctomycetota bacterium]|jgi:putative nucleotidyltransferase with HDIG domain
MPQLQNQQIVARQVERIVRQLTSLSTLPAVVADLLSKINESPADSDLLVENIQADPALTAKVLMLAHQEGVQFTNGPAIAEAVAKLPLTLLREAVISVKVFQIHDSGDDADGKRLLPRKQMALHSLATACCAGQIAECVLEPGQRQTAYLAGLLHDIGKCALDEVMPKSFAKMVAQARDSQSSLAAVEQQHLGLDHAVIGKRLAQKWGLPEAITSAIWLHHCDAQTLSADLPDVDIARVVALANQMAHRAGLGQSGSCDPLDSIEELAALVSINSDQLEEISNHVTQMIQTRGNLLGLQAGDETAGYYTMIHKTAAELAQDNRKLTTASRDYLALSGQAELIDDFLNQVDENTSALEIAEALARCWQKHCRSGLTGVYVVPDSTEPYVELAVMDRRGRLNVRTLHMPDQVPPVPEAFRTQASVLPAADGARWLTDQLEADFNPRLLKMAPLRMGDEVVGVLVFEAFTEEAPDGAKSDMPLSCKVAASAIAMAQAAGKHERLAERFVQVMSTLRQTRAELARQQTLTGLAEMAAGAAHELNNPLSVISGRAQLLADSESDEDKKQMLAQIRDRTGEISQIITDLLAFARPTEPAKRSVLAEELLAKAIEATCRQCGLGSMEIEIAGEAKQAAVYVDVHQVTQSLSFVLTNALQSYKGGNGPVWIDCAESLDEHAVSAAIRDTGCGMDAETLANACQPFFSSHPAGRKRGMGLAHAQRLLLLNGGDLKITSQPDKGTTVTITLPKV